MPKPACGDHQACLYGKDFQHPVACSGCIRDVCIVCTCAACCSRVGTVGWQWLVGVGCDVEWHLGVLQINCTTLVFSVSEQFGVCHTQCYDSTWSPRAMVPLHISQGGELLLSMKALKSASCLSCTFRQVLM
jgi:hypothetical protein